MEILVIYGNLNKKKKSKEQDKIANHLLLIDQIKKCINSHGDGICAETNLKILNEMRTCDVKTERDIVENRLKPFVLFSVNKPYVLAPAFE